MSHQLPSQDAVYPRPNKNSSRRPLTRQLGATRAVEQKQERAMKRVRGADDAINDTLPSLLDKGEEKCKGGGRRK